MCQVNKQMYITVSLPFYQRTFATEMLVNVIFVDVSCFVYETR